MLGESRVEGGVVVAFGQPRLRTRSAAVACTTTSSDAPPKHTDLRRPARCVRCVVRARRVIACGVGVLMLGAVVNFGVAIACALWSPAEISTRTSLLDAAELSQFNGLVGNADHWPIADAEKEIFRSHTRVRLRGNGVCISVLMGTDHAALNLAAEGSWESFQEVPTYSIIVIRAGWPFDTLTSSTDVVEAGSTKIEWKSAYCQTIRLQPQRVLSASAAEARSGVSHLQALTAERPLPLGIIRNGAIFSTLFWTGVLAIPFTAIRFARRHRRMMRGRCPACAYPIGVDPRCTECGEKLPFGIRGRPTADGT